MELEWSLKELYPDLNSKEFSEDFNRLKTMIKDIDSYTVKNLNNYDNIIVKLEKMLTFQNDFETLVLKLSEYCSLILSTNASDEKAMQTLNQIEDIITDITPSSVLFQKWVSGIPDFNSVVNSSKLIKEHLFYLNELREKAKYTLSEKEETIISKMQTTGSASWTKLQELLTSNIMPEVNIDGEIKELPLPAVRNLAYSPKKEVRKAGYEAELKAYPQIDDSIAYALNGIKGEVITVSKLKGYKSPLEMTLINSRMDLKTLESMFTAMKESLPEFRKYFRKKAELLGYENGLPFYEIFAPIGKSNLSFTYEEASDYIVEKFNSFSQKLGDFAKYAFEHNWIDVLPRQGKRGGAFCSNLHCIGESRVLTNFTGSYSDVVTIAHELGHAYHGDCLKSEYPLNSDYPMPIAETASTFCETIVNQATLKNADKETSLTILESSISDAAQVIVDILSRFIFEDTVFKRRSDGFLSAEELCSIMLDAQQQTYGDGLDSNYLHKYMWLCKPHYYDANYNYYNFPYAFGLLFAKGLYSKYQKEGENFVKHYDNLLGATGKNSLYDVAKLADIDLHSIDFWRSSIEVIKKDIDKFISI